MTKFFTGAAAGAATLIVGAWIWLIYQVKKTPESQDEEE